MDLLLWRDFSACTKLCVQKSLQHKSFVNPRIPTINFSLALDGGEIS